MRIIADTHCHTVASGHAYSTAMEMITAAKEKNLYAIALTDHGKNLPVSYGKYFFKNLRSIPEVLKGVRVLKGIELNIIDHLGNTDDDPSDTSKLEWRIASIHHTSYEGEMGIEAFTNTWTQIANNPIINVIGHCEIDDFKFDYEKVIPLFGKNGKLVEINNNSINVRTSSMKNLYEVAKVCKKHKVRVIINSDAHFCTQVGSCENSIKILKEIDFPESLIVNTNEERFKSYLKERGILC